MNSVTLKNINQELEYIDPQEKEIIRKNIQHSMSFNDLGDVLGQHFKDDIILYSILDNYNSIEELLPRNKSFKILLIRDSEYSGHYVTIMRYKKTIEFYDSYGTYPSKQLDYTKRVNQGLGQSKDELLDLLKDAQQKGYNVVYNKTAFQQYSTNIETIATCGRHVLFRIIMLLKYNYDLNKFVNFFMRLKRRYKMSFDELVSLIIK